MGIQRIDDTVIIYKSQTGFVKLLVEVAMVIPDSPPNLNNLENDAKVKFFYSDQSF